jgi:hypothetical protein
LKSPRERRFSRNVHCSLRFCPLCKQDVMSLWNRAICSGISRVFLHPLNPSWNLQVLIGEGGKTREPGENPLKLVNSTYMWHQVWDLNLGHSGERQVLSLLHDPCFFSLKFQIKVCQIHVPLSLKFRKSIQESLGKFF